MPRVRLIHWNAVETEERAAKLRALGYDVASEPLDQPALRELRRNPPDAVIIDLARLPSQGRDVAVTLRTYKSIRQVPLIMVGGTRDDVKSVRAILPDVVHSTWKDIGPALDMALAAPPAKAVVPESAFAGYSGTPLPKKLGIKASSSVVLVGAPEEFEKTLGPLPEDVVLRRDARGKRDVTIWFVDSQKELRRRIVRMGEFADGARLWIAWPKKSSGVVSDVTEPVVRETGLATGLVDYKICAIDKTWSGLLFAKRRAK